MFPLQNLASKGLTIAIVIPTMLFMCQGILF